MTWSLTKYWTLFSLAGLLFVAGCHTPDRRPPIHYKVIPQGSETRTLHKLEKPRPIPVRMASPITQDTTKRELVKNEAYRWMGAPYRIGGNTKKGVDCSGFTSQVYLQAIGFKLPRTAATQFQVGTPVSPRTLITGDLVFFKTSSEATINHVGIYIGDGLFAHSSTKKGVIMSSLSHGFYAQAYRGARRILHN